jgi:competence protein ComFC
MLNTIQTPELVAKNPPMIWRFLDVLFPPFCCSCGELGFELCPECINKITLIDQQKICLICGDISDRARICQDCQHSKPYFDQLRSWGEYSGVLRDVIQKYKFDHGLGLTRFLSDPSIEFIQSWGIKINHIVPVPLSNSRLHARGYNQSALLASSISRSLHIEIKPRTLFRIKETFSQVGLNSKERKDNVFNAFKADNYENRNKSVLVIDDIATTGSTLNECARALKNAGAKEVFCYTVAKTPLPKKQLEGMEDK